MNTLSLITLVIAQASGLPKFDVKAQAPESTSTDLQIICLFRSTPKNKLAGALAETDKALKGLLSQVRSEERFSGALGETLVLLPPAGGLKAKRLMLIGLGDSTTFMPERMRLIGRIAMRECDRMRIAHPYFAPTIKDGGVGRYTTGQIAEQFVLGAMDEFRLAAWLQAKGANGAPRVTAVTYLAGPQYAPSTQAGIEKALGRGK